MRVAVCPARLKGLRLADHFDSQTALRRFAVFRVHVFTGF